jgi:hypothetical protein
MARTAIVLTIMLVANMTSRIAVAAEDSAGVARAKEFWSAIAKGDPAGMKEFCANEVTLRPGSELLKQEWGIKGAGDRNKELRVSRDDLLAAYQRMIDKIGREKWIRIFGSVPAEKIVVSSMLTSAQSLNLQTKPGDLVLMVRPGNGDDTLYYVFRHVEMGSASRWQIVAELTDY